MAVHAHSRVNKAFRIEIEIERERETGNLLGGKLLRSYNIFQQHVSLWNTIVVLLLFMVYCCVGVVLLLLWNTPLLPQWSQCYLSIIIFCFIYNDSLKWEVSTPLECEMYRVWIQIQYLMSVVLGWQPRWFVLDNGIISYYDSQDDVCKGSKGSIKMSVCEIKGKNYCFFFNCMHYVTVMFDCTL